LFRGPDVKQKVSRSHRAGDRQGQRDVRGHERVGYSNDGNHLIIKAIAADTSVVEFRVQVIGWP
jgi:hypothetical protein